MQNFTSYNVPTKYQPYIDLVMKDSDGIWLYLKDGYISSTTDCGTIHEDTWKEVLHMLRTTLTTDNYQPVFPRKSSSR